MYFFSALCWLDPVKASDQAQVDAVIALAMSAERVEHQAQPLQILGWL